MDVLEHAALAPASEADLADALRDLGSAPVEISGNWTKKGLGRPVDAAHRIALNGLTGIQLYEPEELVMTVRAGTPVAEVEAELAAHGQMLAFEPLDLGPLDGQAAHSGTIGGMIACNLSGPRRIKAGAARDHLLGFRAVTADGAAFKAGGRVVKNVTGFDIPKLMAGSFGTLAALTEVTLKVLPQPQVEHTLVVGDLDPSAASTLMTAAMGLPVEVSAACHLWPEATRAWSWHGAATLIRLEGPAESVAARRPLLEAFCASSGPLQWLEGLDSRDIWGEIRQALPLARSGDRPPILRASIAPADLPAYCALAGLGPEAWAFADWAGGLVWHCAVEADLAEVLARARAAVARLGGHVTIIKARADLRRQLAPFQPPSPPEAMLERRLKDQFDPKHRLNPGRLRPDF
ncbi:FAD-binding protein [Zavarzinia sp. CC-PAN008]|uniref:FAD-binding protein n=1 Tax=Zavarzinia sp. CC-PAN008 TaxID=3243332 RepID=UPI003F742664